MRFTTAAVGTAENREVADTRDGAQDEGDDDTNFSRGAEGGQSKLQALAAVAGVLGEVATHIPFRVVHLVQHICQ